MLEVLAVLGMRWQPGEAVSQAEPAWAAPAGGRRIMTMVDLPALKRRHPLGDVVEASGVQLRGGGRVRQGVCPFHEETEGSFTVYGDSERWFCFGCGEGGDVLDFITDASKSLSLPEAIRAPERRRWGGLQRRRRASGGCVRRPAGRRSPNATPPC